MARTSQPGVTGLLTRFVPERLRHGTLYRWWLRLTRVLQFVSAVISLGIFSSRIYKVYRLVNSFKAHRGLDNGSKAVEGILAAAVFYTLIATIMMCIFRGGGPKWLRWLWVLLDLFFVVAFIAVSVLTRPNGGVVGPRHCYDSRGQQLTGTGEIADRRDESCNLPWGTFILAIISTILHAITASFHEVKDQYRQHKLERNNYEENQARFNNNINNNKQGTEWRQPEY
ncbi:hypothetical protein B0J13DRAFT_628881 [Dactylonectria estremocensis]|uniref:MARVEL domain-containing protein n=1 Tax=Dactylonectria estremocensis TaxID=1079267 RepID=A0A9P9IIF3_9HYPO|nr:hypothetical protein B0J13DRAFT_628881 [Dactylonectria estremocensis]